MMMMLDVTMATRVAAALLLPLLLIGWADQVVALSLDRPLSPPLWNRETHQTVDEVSKHFQALDDDTSTRLAPRVSDDPDHLQICCLHANILDFYLSNILPHRKDQHPKMPRLRTDLSRVNEDLQAHGCNVTRYHDHRHAVDFRKKLNKMSGDSGINKAIGEVDILFTFLADYCVHSKKDAANANASTAAPL